MDVYQIYATDCNFIISNVKINANYGSINVK
jgi:hypothetical protein